MGTSVVVLQGLRVVRLKGYGFSRIGTELQNLSKRFSRTCSVKHA